VTKQSTPRAAQRRELSSCAIRNAVSYSVMPTAVRCIMSNDDGISALVPSHPKAARDLPRLRHLPVKLYGAS
jgi:hypothetical protein